MLKKSQLRNNIKNFLFKIIYFKNYFTGPGNFDGVKILLYHDIGKVFFEEHIRYLKSKYKIISLSQMLKNYEKGLEMKNTFVITFDDGIKENFELLEIIIRNNFKPTIFITGYVNSDLKFWFSGLSQKKLIQFLNLENKSRLKKIKSNYVNKRESLNHIEIEQMKDYVDFQPHTISHPSLIKCSIDEIKFEIIESSDLVNKISGSVPFAFAPPFGIYDDRVINFLKEIGFKCCLSIKPGTNKKNENLFELKRIGIPKHCDLFEFVSRIDGIWDKIRKLPLLKNYSSFYNQFYEKQS
tara:strand:- start:6177 stop:7064 length:888 start_codon:yes stop_codon:yes gene_type:complete